MSNISPLQKIIKGALHDSNIIDSGISDTIAGKLDPIIDGLINNQAMRLSTAAQCLEGLLANPHIMDKEFKPEEVCRMAINMADTLAKDLAKADTATH